MTTENDDTKIDYEHTNGRMQRLVRPFIILFVCMACLVPGWVIMQTYGFDSLTALPTFWGGMIYHHFLGRFIS